METLIVTKNKEAFTDFAQALSGPDVDVTWADSGASTIEAAKTRKVDLVVIDQKLDDTTPLELVTRLILTDAMINTALVSDLSEHEFHEAGEGLGVLAQLPPSPGADEADNLLNRLKKLTGVAI